MFAPIEAATQYNKLAVLFSKHMAWGVVTTPLARCANLSVERDSEKASAAGETIALGSASRIPSYIYNNRSQHLKSSKLRVLTWLRQDSIIVVQQLPPKESSNSRVSLESRYGTWDLALRSVRAAITLP